MALFDLTHSNASWFGRRNVNDYEIYLDGGKRIKFAFNGTACKIFAKNDYSDGVTKGFAVSVDGGAYTLYGPTAFGSGTVIATGLSEGTHTIEIDGDYNNAGAGTLKLRRIADGGAVEITGATPSVQYATGFGRVRHFGDSGTDTLRQLAGWLSLSGGVLGIVSIEAGLNAGSQIRIRTADRYIHCYYNSRGNAPEVCVFDGRASTRGAILAYGTLASSTNDGVLTLDTGITDGVARDMVLGVAGVPPASVGTEGAGLLTLGTDWLIAGSFGTSLTVTANPSNVTPNQSTKSWPNQLAVRFGWLCVNFGVGGSSLSGYGGVISGDPNSFGRDREDEATTLAASIFFTCHMVNDANASNTVAVTASMFQSQLEAHLGVLTALPGTQKVYALGGETAFQSDKRAVWIPKISAAVTAANAANGDSRCVYLSTDAFYAGVDLYDAVHPTPTGADQIADGVETVLRATLDNDPPTLTTAATDTGGVQLSLTFSEAMGTGTDGLTVKINGTAASVLSYAWNGPHTILTLTMGRGITSTDVVTLDYAPGTLADFAGNALVSITARAVTNNSTVSGGGSMPQLCTEGPYILTTGDCECTPTIRLSRSSNFGRLLCLRGMGGKQRIPVELTEISARLLATDRSVLLDDLPVDMESEGQTASAAGEIIVTLDGTDDALDGVSTCTLEVLKTAAADNVLAFTASVKVEG